MAFSSKRAQLSYTEMFTADELIVELDGVTYTLANKGNGKYGGGIVPNPIGIVYDDGVNTMYINNNFGSGDHHVVIKAEQSSIETTECFKKAVKSVGSGVMMLNLVEGDPLSIEGATWQEAYNALQNGTMVFLTSDGAIFPCNHFVGGEVIAFSNTYVDSDGVYTDTYVWSSDGTVTYTSQKYPPQS